MARRVHLHIGTMKSATTYLQDLCELNLEHLAEAGILWPVGISRYAGVRDLFGRAEPQTDPPAAWKALHHQIRQHPGDVLISNELLAGLDDAKVGQLVEALAPAEVFVVVTVRDPARVIPSAWQTAIRNGEKTYSWKEFSAAVCSDHANDVEDDVERHASAVLHERFWRHHDAARLLQRWQAFVPTEHITLVTVPPSGADRDTVACRFGKAVGVDLTHLPQPRSRGNATLGAHSVELIRRVNLAIPGSDRAARKYGIRTALADSALGSRARLEPRFGLTAAQHSWTVERARRMVDELVALDVRVEGELADLVPTSLPETDVVDPGASTDAQLLEVALHGLIGTTRHAAKLRLKNNELRAELEAIRNGRRRSRGWPLGRLMPRARTLSRRVRTRLGHRA